MREHRFPRLCWRPAGLGARLYVVVSLARIIFRNNDNPRGSLCSQEHDFLSSSPISGSFLRALLPTTTALPALRHASSRLRGPPSPLREHDVMPNDTTTPSGHAPTPVHPVSQRPTGSPGDTVSSVGTAALRATGSTGVTDTQRNPYPAPYVTTALWAALPRQSRFKSKQTKPPPSAPGTQFLHPAASGSSPISDAKHHRTTLPLTPCIRDRHSPHDLRVEGLISPHLFTTRREPHASRLGRDPLFPWAR